MKITAKTKDCFLILNAKTSGSEKIDGKELTRFSDVNLRGFLKPKMVKKNFVEYTGPAGVSVAEFLRKGVSKRDFFYVVEHSVAAIQKLQVNGFPLYYLLMDLRYVYINEATKELQFVYLPTTAVSFSGGIVGLFQAIINLAKPVEEEDTTYVQRFDAFMKNLRPLNLDSVEQFVYYEDRAVVNAIRKNNVGQSGYMTGHHKHHTDSHEHTSSHTNHPVDTAAAKEQPPVTVVDDDVPTMLLDEEADIPTGILQEDDATDILVEEEEEATGILDEDDDDDQRTVCISSSEYNTPFCPVQHTEQLSVTRTELHWEEEDEATAILIEEDDEVTGILEEDDDEELRTICITSTEYDTPICPVRNTEQLSDTTTESPWEEDEEATGILMDEEAEKQPAEAENSANETVVNAQTAVINEDNVPAAEDGTKLAKKADKNKKVVRTPVRVVVRRSASAPVVEPVIEPVVAPVVTPVVEPVAEPVVEPVAEPVVEPVAESVVTPVVAETVPESIVESEPVPVASPAPVYALYPDPDDVEGTALLVEQEVVQPPAAPEIQKKFPVLHRVSTGEEININKPVFRIGKEKSYVDYFVNNNNAVSRSHADIVTRAKGCFVVDLNSKNHTYINGGMIPSHMEVVIKDGDTLRLGNEEFIFKTSGAEKKSNSCPRCQTPIPANARFCIQCGCRIN